MTAQLLRPQEPLAFPVVTELDDAAYFNLPLFSCSGAKRILSPGCPAVFAWEAVHGRPSKPQFDTGHAAHELVLGKGAGIDRYHFRNWMTNEAKAAKKASYAAGRTPLLVAEYREVLEMAKALKRHPLVGGLFRPGRGTAEQVLLWHDERYGINRKAKLDWLPLVIDGRPLIVPDYKSADSANPDSFPRPMANYGYHQQHAWYLDGVRACLDVPDPLFVFVVQEKHPPYLITVLEVDEPSVEVGQAKNARAMEVYAECVAAGEWPAYTTPDEIASVSLPAWADRNY